jgi:hypothetical protein
LQTGFLQLFYGIGVEGFTKLKGSGLWNIWLGFRFALVAAADILSAVLTCCNIGPSVRGCMARSNLVEKLRGRAARSSIIFREICTN